MTIGEAKKLLVKPVFGDANCIQAAALVKLSDWLATLKEKARGRQRPCSECDGDGRKVCPTCGFSDVECSHCDGKGVIEAWPWYWAEPYEDTHTEQKLKEFIARADKALQESSAEVAE